jgi:dynein heavy chain, axonemal
MANALLAAGMKEGHWVLLANCHLMISWMNALEKVVEGLSESKPHREFRLWLSSYPHPKFPISILQAGIKMVTEPPKGLKANMIRLYNNMNDTQFSRCQAGVKYRKLLFCLVFFHAVLVERRKFGTLGYNVPYDFNESDFDISEDCLAYYLDAYPTTPWDALRYLIADANYGGRVTDDFDFRLVRTYIRSYFVEEALSAEVFQLAPPLEIYRIPDDGPMRAYTDYIRGLPVLDNPEAFGQHGNADIAAQIADTTAILDTLGGLQPQEVGGGGGGGREERVLKLTRDLAETVPAPLDLEACRAHKADDPSALHVFLLQELERYNKLLRAMSSSLRDVQRGIRGLVVMSAELDDVVSCLTVGKVPPTWGRCFPSLKPLASWMRDVAQRVAMLGAWAEGSYPKVYWMSGFSYPTGFLTALLQTSARASGVSVDVLSWEFTVLPCYEEAEVQAAPPDGAYIRGMFLEGARWDGDGGSLADPRPMELVVPFPVVHFRPAEARKRTGKAAVYSCPCYMYPVRTGSRERPSYTVSVDLRSGAQEPDHWVKRGGPLSPPNPLHTHARTHAHTHTTCCPRSPRYPTWLTAN